MITLQLNSKRYIVKSEAQIKELKQEIHGNWLVVTLLFLFVLFITYEVAHIHSKFSALVFMVVGIASLWGIHRYLNNKVSQKLAPAKGKPAVASVCLLKENEKGQLLFQPFGRLGRSYIVKKEEKTAFNSKIRLLKCALMGLALIIIALHLMAVEDWAHQIKWLAVVLLACTYGGGVWFLTRSLKLEEKGLSSVRDCVKKLSSEAFWVFTFAGGALTLFLLSVTFFGSGSRLIDKLWSLLLALALGYLIYQRHNKHQ